MVSSIAINFIDVIFNLMKASKSKFFQILENSEIQSFKLTSSIKLIVDGGSVEIMNGAFDILFAPYSNQKFLI